MDPIVLACLITAGITAVVSAILTWFVASNRSSRTIAQLRATWTADEVALRVELARAEEAAAGLQAQLTQQQDRQRSDAERQREEQQVLRMLAPVQETLRAMQAKVSELEQQRSQQYGAIAEQLQQTRLAGEQVRVTADSLAAALRNNSTRGAWGEAQLRNIVEAAGLTHRVDFDLQSSVTTDRGTGRPDMTVHIPGGKSIAVDAKVPFDAYLEASAISASGNASDQARRTALLTQHVRAVRGHIDALAQRGYWHGLEASPELVIAFIPSESLLSAALEADPSLLEYAFRKGVALSSPVSFFTVLKAVAFTWQQEVLTDDAKRLFDLSRTLYQRIATLGEHAEGLRRSLERTVEQYNRFASSLETRVLVTARQLNQLDESKVLGEVPPITASPRGVTAAELFVDDE